MITKERRHWTKATTGADGGARAGESPMKEGNDSVKDKEVDNEAMKETSTESDEFSKN